MRVILALWQVPLVAGIYCTLFGFVALTIEQLDFSDLKWGPEDASRLARAMDAMPALTSLDLSSNNLAGETVWVNPSKVEGESKEVGAKVTYQGREMFVSKGVDRDGHLKLATLRECSR